MSNIKITILGSGDTLGTPVSGSTTPASLDEDSKRLRFGLLIESGDQTILIDPNPDLKWQCLSNKFELKHIDHILVTHHHSDHINGLGEFFYRRPTPTKLWYGNHPLNHKLMEYWKYLEAEKILSFKTFVNFQSFRLGDKVEVLPIELNHSFPTSGFIISCNDSRIAIVTDTNIDLSKQTLAALERVDIIFADAFSENLKQVEAVYKECGIKTPDLNTDWFHMTFSDVKSLQQTTRASKIYTVHMSRHLSPHHELVARYQTDNYIIGQDNLCCSI